MALPVVSLRRMLYVLVPCLGFTVYIGSVYNAFGFNPVRSSPTEVMATTTHGDFKHEMKKPLQSHLFRSDGLLEVNPNGRHPIYDLIEHAEAEWDKKLKRQSKTLDEAVAEYERRYGRAPPKGFDKWWFYCKKHNVQLPDEYDRIHHDLEPFWGINPVDLNRVQAEHESHRDSFTLGKTEESLDVKLLTYALPGPGEGFNLEYHLSKAKEIAGMLDEVAKFIPPFRAVFSPHDNPTTATDWELKSQALQAAAARTYINMNVTPPAKDLGWPSACSPDSSLRHTTLNLDVPPTPSSKKTFIYDHSKAMDPCSHPSLLHHHGQFLRWGQGPVPDQMMIPAFSFCSTSLDHDIVTAIEWAEEPSPDINPKFQDRLDERLTWRGSTTGMWQAEDTKWRNSQRIHLVGWANERNGTVSVLQPTKSRNERVGEGQPVAKARLNPAMLDITFAGKPHSCTDAVCETIGEEFEFRNWRNPAVAGNYKYLLDVDGNAWSSRYMELISSHALVFKSTVFPEWFQDRIQQWKHYVPVQVDLSDLADSLVFFRGDLKGDGAHEELAAQIALAGRDWAKTFWRDKDMTAYMFRLFLEYARVMSLDREALSYRKN